MSPIDAVDGSSTGTRVPWMWGLLKLLQFGGASGPTREDCARRTSSLTISSVEMAKSALEMIRGKSGSDSDYGMRWLPRHLQCAPLHGGMSALGGTRPSY